MVTSEVLAKLKSAYTEWYTSGGTSIATWMNLMADDIQNAVAGRRETGNGIFARAETASTRCTITSPRVHGMGDA